MTSLFNQAGPVVPSAVHSKLLAETPPHKVGVKPPVGVLTVQRLIDCQVDCQPLGLWCSAAASTDEHEPSTCIDGRQRTALDEGEELEVRPVTPRLGPRMARGR
jgi:hypothetical protein